MRQTAFLLAVVAMLSWGLWVVFARVAGETLTGEVIVVITYLVGGAVGVAYLLLRGTTPTFSSTAVTYAVASGLFFGIGGLAYYAALWRGTTATTVAAMYFVVASLLAFVFLGEPLRVRDGIGLGVGAVLLLATWYPGGAPVLAGAPGTEAISRGRPWSEPCHGSAGPDPRSPGASRTRA